MRVGARRPLAAVQCSAVQYRHAYFLLCVAAATVNQQQRCYSNSTFADTASDRSALRT
jgi:hypothetical protein